MAESYDVIDASMIHGIVVTACLPVKHLLVNDRSPWHSRIGTESNKQFILV